jgi:hypothetical protein
LKKRQARIIIFKDQLSAGIRPVPSEKVFSFLSGSHTPQIIEGRGARAGF